MAENSDKRIPKGDLKVNFTPNEEQKKAIADFYSNDISIITSDFGTGKSTIAAYIGLQCLQKKMFDKVIFCRPVLKSRINVLGFTPGNSDEKLNPFVEHLRYILKRMYKPNLIQKYEQNFKEEKSNAIGFMQLELMKGWTLDSTLLIIDEFQDLDYKELRNLLSRVSKDSKIILLGSFEQIDVSMRNSAIHVFEKVKEDLPQGVAWNTLTINNRNDKMYELIKKLDKFGI